MQLIQELLADVYPLARQTLIYAETITGEMEYKGAGEFRDVLEHLKRAIVDAESDDEARDDITEAQSAFTAGRGRECSTCGEQVIR